MFKKSPTLSLSLAAAALALSPLAQAAAITGIELSGAIGLYGAPNSGAQGVGSHYFNAVQVGAGVEFQFDQWNTGLSVMDDSRLNFDLESTATGGLLNITYEMTSSGVWGMNFQFYGQPNGIFSNWRRVSDNFDTVQLAGFQDGWDPDQIGNVPHGLTFSLSFLQTWPSVSSYQVTAQYAFDYTTTTVPTPPTGPTPGPSVVSTPGTSALLALGLGAMALTGRRQRRKLAA